MPGMRLLRNIGRGEGRVVICVVVSVVAWEGADRINFAGRLL